MITHELKVAINETANPACYRHIGDCGGQKSKREQQT
jgi:hypothetical protein